MLHAQACQVVEHDNADHSVADTWSCTSVCLWCCLHAVYGDCMLCIGTICQTTVTDVVTGCIVAPRLADERKYSLCLSTMNADEVCAYLEVHKQLGVLSGDIPHLHHLRPWADLHINKRPVITTVMGSRHTQPAKNHNVITHWACQTGSKACSVNSVRNDKMQHRNGTKHAW